jgi:quercetin dioxygenase-like cupin family protein
MTNSADPAPVQPITRTVLMSVPLAAAKNTSHVEARRIRLLPGAAGGMHVHNCPVVGNIVEGSVTYQIDGQSPSVLRTGDVFLEPEGARIARFDATDEGATFIAWFLLEPGQVPELIFLDQ